MENKFLHNLSNLFSSACSLDENLWQFIYLLLKYELGRDRSCVNKDIPDCIPCPFDVQPFLKARSIWIWEQTWISRLVWYSICWLTFQLVDHTPNKNSAMLNMWCSYQTFKIAHKMWRIGLKDWLKPMLIFYGWWIPGNIHPKCPECV